VAASLAARERFERALAGQGREAAASERGIAPGPHPSAAADGSPVEHGKAAAPDTLAVSEHETPEAEYSTDHDPAPDAAAATPDPASAVPAVGPIAPQPGAGSGASDPGADGAKIGAGAAVSGVAGQSGAAAAGVEPPLGQTAFGDLVARYRESFGEASVEIDGAAAGGWAASAGQPLAEFAGRSEVAASPAASPPEAVRMAEFLLRQMPLAGSPGDPVSMIFPQGSGPIDQIVFMRDPSGLFMVVSSQPGSRDAVQRGLGELERRLRERGIAVGGIRLAEPVASARDHAEGGVG
jgi:hypothetical protein